MKPVLGSLGANTLVILTPAEMAALRAQLDPQPGQTNSAAHQEAARKALASGIQRGTTHLQAELTTQLKKR